MCKKFMHTFQCYSYLYLHVSPNYENILLLKATCIVHVLYMYIVPVFTIGINEMASKDI